MRAIFTKQSDPHLGAKNLKIRQAKAYHYETNHLNQKQLQEAITKTCPATGLLLP